jgi:hypothetical protein
MRFFGLGRRQVQHDPEQQQVLHQQVRQVHFPEPPATVVQLLQGDDGLVVAAGVLRDFADSAHADLLTQAAALQRRTGRRYVVDRRNYRPLWEEAGSWLRWSLFELPGGLHPYVQVAAAATVVGAGARRSVRVSDPGPLLAHLFEVLDLTIDGWQYGRVRVDTDGAALAGLLISAAQQLRAAMAEPPPLPPPIREMMRSNATVEVRDPTMDRIVGTFNPGREMRESLLV